MDEAGQLRGAELCLRAEEREPLPEGEYYYDDLKGLAVVDLATGERLGTVTGFTEGVGPECLRLKRPWRAQKAARKRGRFLSRKKFAWKWTGSREIRVRLPGIAGVEPPHSNAESHSE